MILIPDEAFGHTLTYTDKTHQRSTGELVQITEDTLCSGIVNLAT
ncbi:MAG: hypothetical protein V3W04_05950 [Gammaproteobacteria bacterium]